MSQFAVAWRLSRSRFLETIAGLDHAQLVWRLQPGALTLGESALHVAGVEILFASQLLDAKLNDYANRLKSCATDGVVNERAFPFAESELTADMIQESLGLSESMLKPLMDKPSQELLQKEIVSALGPVIPGEGALARLAFHAAYHQGQAYLIRSAPGFP